MSQEQISRANRSSGGSLEQVGIKPPESKDITAALDNLVSGNNVRLIYGAHDLLIPVGGLLSVAETIAGYQAIINLEPDAKPYLNDQAVTNTTVVVQTNDVLTFQKEAGRKG